MQKLPIKNVVIVGAGMAGLITAKVLLKADPNLQITIVDSDELINSADPRDGVPQGIHAHNVSAEAWRLLLDTALLEKMERVGVLECRRPKNMLVHLHGWIGPDTDSEDWNIFTFGITRPQLELFIREEIEANPRVTFWKKRRVVNLLFNKSQTQVVGVSLESGEKVYRDLVVIANGRNSKVTEWLQQGGYHPPKRRKVSANTLYTSQIWKSGVNMPEGILTLGVADTPETPWAAALIRQELGHTLSTLVTINADPPRNLEQYLELAKKCSPIVYDALKDAVPLYQGFRSFPCDSYWTPYWEMSEFPKGLILIGDVITALNPRYGTGITDVLHSAMSALSKFLEQGDELAYLKNIKKVTSNSLRLALSADLKYPFATIDDRPPTAKELRASKILRPYMSTLERSLPHDKVLAKAFFQVSNHQLPPSALLLSPRLMVRVLGHMLKKS